MRRLFLLMGVVIGLASCVKDEVDASFRSDSEMKTVKFNFNVKPQANINTRSIDIGTYQDDEIERLDIFIYGSDYILIEHVILEDDDLQNMCYEELHPQGDVRYYLFVANLNAACAEYLEQTKSNYLEDWYSYIPYSLNYKPGKPVMGGSAYVYFNSDQEVNVDLYRYIFRIEVGSIRADFDDESLMNKDIVVKRIVMTNTYNIFPLEKGTFPNKCGTIESIFGTIKKFDFELFGGGYEGYKPGYDAFAISGSYSLSLEYKPEELKGKFPYLLNDNQYVLDSGILKVDVSGYLYDATVIDFDNEAGEGRICSSVDASCSNVLPVNKVFYGMCGSIYTTRSIIAGRDNQDASVKLVIEVSIDGKIYFYPIQVNYPQPNTTYQVQNITLKGMGSEYCNFYQPHNEATLSAKPIDWVNNVVEDIPVGYKGDSFSEIY